MGLHLSGHASFCVANERVFLLDLERSRYYCLPRAVDDAYRRMVAGEVLGEREIRLLASLIEAGVLVQSDEERCVEPPTVEAPTSSALDYSRRGTQLLAPALMSQLAATIALRASPLRRVISRMQEKKRAGLGRPVVADVEAVAASQLVRRMTVAKDQCLVSSIALANLIGRVGAFPELVFGVRATPFGAHCWVQRKDCVLNDTVDNARRFTPILVV